VENSGIISQLPLKIRQVIKQQRVLYTVIVNHVPVAHLIFGGIGIQTI
jgi:hypothetical protein